MVTDKQPEALRLAKRCEWFARTTGGIESAFVGKDMLMEAAAELRRLHEVNAELVETLNDIAEWTERYTTPGHPISTVARAALAKAEEK